MKYSPKSAANNTHNKLSLSHLRRNRIFGHNGVEKAIITGKESRVRAAWQSENRKDCLWSWERHRSGFPTLIQLHHWHKNCLAKPGCS